MRFRTLFGMFVIALLAAATLILTEALSGQAHPDEAPKPQAGLDALIADVSRSIASGGLARDALAAAYVERGDYFRLQRDFERATADYEVALTLVPERSALALSVRQSLIKAYRAKGDYARAIGECDALMRLVPEPYRALLARGQIHAESGAHDAAIGDFSAAIALRPYGYLAYLSRARAYGAHREFARAIADYDFIIKLEPLLFWPRYERARALGRQGRRIESLRAYGGVIGHVYAALFRELARAHKAPRIAALKTHAANAVARWDLDVAIADYAALIREEPDVYEHRLRRGDLYLWDGQTKSAFADYRAAITLAPYAAKPRHYLGDAYAHLFQFDEAIRELSLAIRMAPDDPALYESRARSAFALSRYEEAAADLTKALALNPGDAYAVLWLHLTRLNMGVDDGVELLRHADALPRGSWPEPIVLSFMGLLAEESVQVLARASDDYWTRRNHGCEADFYLGALRLERGDETGALPLLERAARGCHPGFVELTAAAFELQKLTEGY